MKPIRTADGSLTLASQRYGQTYHSHHGALAEARHVFLETSGIASRLAEREPAAVLEVGFGAGLNFAATAAEAFRYATTLEYTALERDLLAADVFESLDYGEAVGHRELWEQFVRWRRGIPPEPREGVLVVDVPPFVSLHLLLGDARDAALPANSFDAVYLDAFSPDRNAELWEPEFLTALVAALRPGGRLVTYAARRSVRDALGASGLEVEQLGGPPGGKREMTLATRP